MNKRSICFILPLIAVLSCATSRFHEGITIGNTTHDRDHREIVQKMDEILDDPALKQAQVGIKVVSLLTGRDIYSRQSQKLFTPASNMKLYTTAAALRFLGPEFQFKTEVLCDSQVIGACLEGNLYLKGYGDPSLETVNLMEMARDVKQAGIDTVQGDIIADGTYFDDWEYGEGWMYNGADSWYAAQIGGLGVNDNCVHLDVSPRGNVSQGVHIRVEPSTDYVTILDSAFTVSDSLNSIRVRRNWRAGENVIVVAGSLGVAYEKLGFWRNIEDPVRFSGTIFREKLAEAGVFVEGGIKEGITPLNSEVLVEHRSLPLSALVAAMNKPSNNLDVEMTLKTVGAEQYGPPGSAKKGVRAVHELLVEAGVSPDSLRMEDGSGLSRYNQVSPAQTVKLLMYMYRAFGMQPEFMASLPIGGIDGTLENRMQEANLIRRVRAKTGTLSGVSALSGYLCTQRSETLCFSIMMQGYVGASRPIRDIQDRMVSVFLEY